MKVTGTVSDFDSSGGFGLIMADDGDFFPFNVGMAPAALRERLRVGTRVRFRTRHCEPAARAVEIIPIDEPNGPGASRGIGLAP